MSRFSKKEAEARGWRFVHEQAAGDVITSETQGEVRHLEGILRAEKDFNGLLINESAESQGKLLERIAAFEATQDAVAASQEAEEPEIVAERDEQPNRTVHLPSGEVITEEEWANREKRDVLIVSDGEGGTKQIVLGGSEEALEADDDREEVAAQAEADRTEEPHGKTVQLEVQAPPIDNPGGHGGGLIIVRKGESIEDAAERREEESAEAESSKSLEPARAEGEEFGTILVETPEERGDSPAEARSEAEEEAAKEQNADPNADEDPAAVHAEGAAAEQALADEAGDAPEATPAAEALAEEEDIDLSEVEGSGAEGRIIKSDVEAALPAEEDPADGS